MEKGVLKQIKQICQKIFVLSTEQLENIQENTRLREDMGLDELNLPALAIALEEQYHISLRDEELAKVQTIRNLIALVTNAKGGR